MSETGLGSGSDPLGPVAEEFLARLRAGGRPSPEEFAARHPELAGRIRAVFPMLIEMERLGPPTADTARGDAGAEAGATGPDQIGDYRILREIGRGGMGIVYEAVQESLGRHVALKVMATHCRAGMKHLERFRLEARSAARLQHPNIVPVYGVGQHKGHPYYIMQFIPGQGLDSVLEEMRRLRGGSPEPGGGGGCTADQTTLSIAQGLLTGRLDFVTADPTAAAGPPPRPAPGRRRRPSRGRC